MPKEEIGVVGRASDAVHQVALRLVHATVQQGLVSVDGERCKGCELCVFECPAHALSLSAGINTKGFRHSEQTNPERCIGCASCALVCPDGCITVRRHSLLPHEKLQNV